MVRADDHRCVTTPVSTQCVEVVVTVLFSVTTPVSTQHVEVVVTMLFGV